MISGITERGVEELSHNANAGSDSGYRVVRNPECAERWDRAGTVSMRRLVALLPQNVGVQSRGLTLSLVSEGV